MILCSAISRPSAYCSTLKWTSNPDNPGNTRSSSKSGNLKQRTAPRPFMPFSKLDFFPWSRPPRGAYLVIYKRESRLRTARHVSSTASLALYIDVPYREPSDCHPLSFYLHRQDARDCLPQVGIDWIHRYLKPNAFGKPSFQVPGLTIY